MKEQKTIAIDFDGVIHKYRKAYHDGTIYDEPVPGTADALRLFKKKGFKLVCFTARKDVQGILDWMKKHNIEVDEVTNIKPRAVWYIDDRAIRFTNWRDMLNYF